MKTTKIRIIFFAIALTYNLLLGIYLKDFLALSPMFTTFYLLSVLPYPTAEYLNNENYFHDYYTDIELSHAASVALGRL